MRILHVVGQLTLNWGGVSLFVAEIANEQSRQGHQVSIFVGTPFAKSACHEIESAIAINDAADSLPEWVAEAEIVHVHGLWLPLYHRALRAARRQGIPTALSTHGMLEPTALRFSRWRKRAAWMLYQRRDFRTVSLLHVTAPAERETLRKLRVRQPLVVASPGVQLPPAESLQGKKGGLHALFLGRLHPIKGIDLLIEAWLAVAPAGWTLQVAGPDEANLRGMLSERVAASGKESVRIEWLGERFGPAKTTLLEHADLVIVPSRSENFAITVIEALAFGSPVVTTTGTPWSNLPGLGIGWVCEPQVPSLATALRAACGCPPAERSEMGNRGRNWVAESYSWRRSAQELVDAYADVLDDLQVDD